MPNFDLEYLKTPAKKSILGLSFPMRNDGVGGFLTSNENLGSLRDCVIQLIMTPRGARVFRPDYGTDLRGSVFELMDTSLLNTLKNQISTTIAKYEPRVIVNSLVVDADVERHKIVVQLSLSSKDDLLNSQMVEVFV
tara:strand:- start:1017 stop:1427 length:411 start_codon:yes stop_codon:yes gene_type:complete